MSDPHIPRRPWPRLTEPEPHRSRRGVVVLVTVVIVSAAAMLVLVAWAVISLVTWAATK